MKIITISGAAQHGKDSSADILKSKLESSNKKVLIVHMADYLKFICKQYYGWNGEKDCAGRSILQYVGTDKVRSKIPDFWVDVVIKFLEAFGEDFDYILIPDCRFANEVNKFRSMGIHTTAIKVIRNNFDNGLTEEQKNHPSERALDNFKFDYIMCSKSGLDVLEIEVNNFLRYYKNTLLKEG